jgi:hypothetical protein
MVATSGTADVYHSEVHKFTFGFLWDSFCSILSSVLCFIDHGFVFVFVFLTIILYDLDRFTAYNYLYDIS